MAIRDILVHIDSNPRSAVRLEVAAGLVAGGQPWLVPHPASDTIAVSNAKAEA